MSRDIAGSNSYPLTSELFQTSVYKPNQGRIVRQLTALAIWVVVALGCWTLYARCAAVLIRVLPDSCDPGGAACCRGSGSVTAWSTGQGSLTF